MFDTIVYEDLAEKVYNSLKNLILDGELVPGEKLRQEELAARLGVSRTPLAAAFSKLEKEMLIELLPRRGARVRTLSNRELLDFYDIRIRLEGLGAREAAARFSPLNCGPYPPCATENERHSLEKSLASYGVIVAKGQVQDIKRADFEFHLSIMALSGNEALYRMVASSNIVFISNQRGILKPPEQSLAEHEKLVEAILSGDAANAEAFMEFHLGGSRSSLYEAMLASHDDEIANDPEEMEVEA